MPYCAESGSGSTLVEAVLCGLCEYQDVGVRSELLTKHDEQIPDASTYCDARLFNVHDVKDVQFFEVQHITFPKTSVWKIEEKNNTCLW